MRLYEEIKEVAKIVKESGNVELFSKLTELSSQALDMQSEITQLTSDLTELKKESEIKQQIVRYKELFVTLMDNPDIRYCSHCWDSDKKLIQIQCYDTGSFRCPHCDNTGVYDSELDKNSHFPPMFLGGKRNNYY